MAATKQSRTTRPERKARTAQSAVVESTQIDRRTGLPRKGKRSNPGTYRQVSAWIRRDTYDAVTTRLFLDGRQEFSEFLQKLLDDWLRESSKGRKRW